MSTSYTPDQLDQEDEDERNANAQLMADLKEQVQRAEQASEQYRKQLEILQQRLDEATNEQTAAEERDFRRQTELDKLRAEVKDSARQRRELEMSNDSEKRMLLQDRERSIGKEAELQAVIGRLNERLRDKSIEKSNANRAGKSYLNDSGWELIQEANLPDDDTPDPSAVHLQALQEKDNIIDAMQIELAELHLKAAEQTHAGDGRLQHLEKEILDTKMLNARLLEENESFQMLLSEKTLKGDFAPEHHDEDTSGLNTLAEELGNYGDDPEAQNEAIKKLEAENRQFKDQNKALTVYIDKIIGRLLSNPGFEHIILDKDSQDDDMPPPPPPKGKALPAAPSDDAPQTAMGGFLQRAKSVVSRSAGGPPRPRPNSIIQASHPSANENPQTAPSIPLNRGHRRGRSDQTQQDSGMGQATVIQQMTRSSTFRTPSSGPLSPGLGPVSPQQSLGSKQGYFSSPPPPHACSTPGSRAPSHNLQQPSATGSKTGSSRNSVASDNSFTPSAEGGSGLQQTNTANTSTTQGSSKVIPGAVMKQNQMRPLRLVNQVKDEEEADRKANNRGSWMGWFNRGAAEGAPQQYQ